MGVRFRRRIRVVPGFYINFNKTGMSATIGIKGASVNIGKTGASLNTGIPGTGIYSRTKLKGRVKDTEEQTDIPNNIITPQSGQGNYSQEGEIKSYNPEFLTSEGLFGLKESIINAQKVKKLLKEESLRAKSRKNAMLFFVIITHILIIGLFISKLRKVYKEKTEDYLFTKEQYDDFNLEIDFNFDKEILNSYLTLKRTFEVLTNCEKKWDVTISVANDRVRTRSAASTSITKTPISIGTNSLNFIKCKYEAFHLQNINGADIFIYPGFIILNDENDFGIIDFRDIQFKYNLTKFIEQDALPKDTKIVDRTWKYVNKNGKPDKRFKDNYEIPIVLYADLELLSSSGLHEYYQFSNPDSGIQFFEAIENYKNSLSELDWSKGELLQIDVKN